MHHARLHEELMRNEGNYSDPCSECGQQIPVCTQVKESFQRVSHVLAKHHDNEDRVREAIHIYENDHSGENDIMLLNGQRSLELSQNGFIKFACNLCDFSCSNGYALIEHAKLHETIESKKGARVIKRESPTVCPYCNRMLLCSTQYSPRVTLLSHFVKFHRLSRINCADFMSKCATWRVSSEFPYIDPVISIKKGKLQCVVCEASLPDVTQMLKHARTVHETYQPNDSNDETMLDGDLSLNQPENEEDEDLSSTVPRSETPKEAKIFGNICKEHKVRARATASPTHQEREDDSDSGAVHSESDRETNKVSYVLRTPKEESKRESVQRLSRSYAPANDRIPQLPSSFDDELNKECSQEDDSVTANFLST
ncbi:zinc finger, C2H2 type [Ancylostoma caninum]|uniref:Zinc finger, C2H2 type n=1 Tax=Ancylostoma caninum TaxID=29170 RepID=A0A368F534_ANCCA|nr:zinc finger, C2H2 type [Ancylostoma caninum]